MATIEARLQTLEASLEELRDREAIRDVLVRYARALDWLDEGLLEQVFFDDADIDYGFFKGSGKAFRPVVMDIERASGRRWHFSAQEKIELQGRQAKAESYGIAIASDDVAATPGSVCSQFIGLYRDRLEKRDGRWGLIARQYILLTATQFPETVMDGPLGALNLIGHADPSHPAFDRFGD